MNFTVNCPNCGMGLAAAHEHIGRQGKCSSCGTVFDIVPPAGSAAVPPVATLLPPSPSEPVTSQPPPTLPPLPYPAFIKPGKVQAISIMMLIGGILALVGALAMAVGSAGFCCLWPGTYYGLVFGVMAIVRASGLLGEQAYLQPPPKGIAIMQIVNIVNGDIANCVMGIIALVFLGEPEVRQYFRG